MTQSKFMSAVEAVTNTLVGYGVAVGTQMIVFPIYGLDPTLTEQMGIGAVFVLVSLVRSYLLRRAFAGAWKRPVAQRRPRWHDHRPQPSQAAPGRTGEAD